MNRDSFNREINYLRFSVTAKCNFRCVFCSPQNYGCFLEEGEELSDSDILKIIFQAAEIGFTKIRLTGGEPMLRPNLPNLIREIRKIRGIAEVAITTNGSVLGRFAEELSSAGVKRINVNLPSLSEERYQKLTGTNFLKTVLSGVEKAKTAGIGIKINVVATSDLSEKEVKKISDFAEKNAVSLRFIEAMPLGINPAAEPLATGVIENWLKRSGIFAEIISSSEKPFCSACNRLRISSSGEIFPCLFGAASHDLRPILADKPNAVKDVLREAIAWKPESSRTAEASETNRPTIRIVGG